MKRLLLVILEMILIFALSSCSNMEINENKKDEKVLSLENNEGKKALSGGESNIGNYLFNADKMESIEISGNDVFDRKEAEITAELEKGRNIELCIKREDPGHGMIMGIYSDGEGIDMVSNLESIDEWAGAKPDFYYQMVCYDFNNDGEKEIIIAAGNKKDVLELYVFQLELDSEFGKDNPQLLTSVHGGYKSYVNEKNEICVINDQNHLSIYEYDEEKQREEAGKDLDGGGRG